VSVFISYSTKDKDFVDKLSIELVKKRIHVWLDKWAMKPGDSLIDKIQEGLTDSAYLLVVLSHNSLESEWCKKELNAGLMKELEARHVVVIPILLEDCNIPLFLKEKVYADFRTCFDDGFSNLLRSLSSLFSEHMGRTSTDEIITDYSIHWGINDKGLFFMNIDFINWYQAKRKSILLQINIVGCQIATERFLLQQVMGMDWLMKESIISMMCVNPTFKELNILLENNTEYNLLISANDKTENITFTVKLRGVLLGEDTSDDMLINFIDFLEMLESSRRERLKK
jgi:hypothetical protein